MSLFVLLNILLVSNHAPAINYKQIPLHLCVSSKHTHTKKKNPYKTTTNRKAIHNQQHFSRAGLQSFQSRQAADFLKI